MIGRIIKSLAFVAGGVVTWFVTALIDSIDGSSALIMWLACSYFVVSAVGVVACLKREALRVVALVAHLLLLAAFLVLCSKGLGNGSEKFFTSLMLLSLVTVVFFSPWFVVWFFILSRRNGVV